MPNLEDVFTPNDFPTHSYVRRSSDDSEEKLVHALNTPKQPISMSGPSKSGKTVLIEKIIGKENIIKVSGIEIGNSDDLWNRILDSQDFPVSKQMQAAKQRIRSGSLSVSVKAGEHLSANLGVQESLNNGETAGQNYARRGMTDVVELLSETKFVVFVDDFHYIKDEETQIRIARQIKAGAERGIKFCIASVPHRSDDVVRSNNELRGRTANIDTKFWSTGDLERIGRKGFQSLNYDVDEVLIRRFAEECCGSPQLMQSLCLEASRKKGVESSSLGIRSFSLTSNEVSEVLSRVSDNTQYKTMVDILHQGPKVKGQKRDKFRLVDGSVGDAYRCILLALTQDPPLLAIKYAEFIQRVKDVCVGGSPISGSVQNACRQMTAIALKEAPKERIIEWVDRAGAGVFNVVDPNFLFYLRHSSQLRELGEE